MRGNSSLTRPGTGAARQVAQQNSSPALRAVFPEMFSRDGWQQPTVQGGSFLGTERGAVTVHARAGRAHPKILGAVDNVTLASDRRITDSEQQNEGSTVSGSVVPAAMPMYNAQPVPLNSRAMSALPAQGDTTSTQHATTNAFNSTLSPKAERLIKVRVPLDFHVEATVTKQALKKGVDAVDKAVKGGIDALAGIADTIKAAAKRADNPDEKTQELLNDVLTTSENSAMTVFSSEESVTVLIPERVLRDLGLLHDDNFPTALTEAYDQVKDVREKVDEAHQQYEEAVIRVERCYEELYRILREARQAGQGPADDSPHPLEASYSSALLRLVEHEIELAGQRDEAERLLGELSKAQLSAQEQLDWYQKAPQDRDDASKPTPYTWDKEEKATRRPLARPTGENVTATTPRSPALLKDEYVHQLVTTARSDGGLWAGSAVPPAHLALREMLKEDALAKALSDKRTKYKTEKAVALHTATAPEEEKKAAQHLVVLRPAELAYLEQAYEQAAKTAEQIRKALDEFAAKRPGEGETEDLVQEQVQHLLSGAPITATDDLAGRLHDAQAALSAARKAHDTAAAGSEARRTASEEITRHQETIDRLTRAAVVEPAVTAFAKEQQPSSFPVPPLVKEFAKEHGDPVQRAVEYLEERDKPQLFTENETTDPGSPVTYTGPDGTVYGVVDPHDPADPDATKGEGLFLSVYEGLKDLAADGLALTGKPLEHELLDPAHGGTRLEIARSLRKALAQRLREDGADETSWINHSNDTGNTLLQPEPGRDVFTQEDLDAARLKLKPEHQLEFDQEGTLHTNVELPHPARVELMALQLERLAHDEKRRAGHEEREPTDAYLVPLLVSGLYGVDSDLVRPDVPVESFHANSPFGPPGPSLPARPKITLLVKDDTVKLLRPQKPGGGDATPGGSGGTGTAQPTDSGKATSGTTRAMEPPNGTQQLSGPAGGTGKGKAPAAPATPVKSGGTPTEQALATPQQSTPLPGTALPVPKDGWCQLSSLLVGAPEHVRRQLERFGHLDGDPEVDALLRDPQALRAAALDHHAQGSPFRRAVRLMQRHVMGLLTEDVRTMPPLLASDSMVRLHRSSSGAATRDELAERFRDIDELKTLRESWLNAWEESLVNGRPPMPREIAHEYAQSSFPAPTETATVRQFLGALAENALGLFSDYAWEHASGWTETEFSSLRATVNAWDNAFATPTPANSSCRSWRRRSTPASTSAAPTPTTSTHRSARPPAPPSSSATTAPTTTTATRVTGRRPSSPPSRSSTPNRSTSPAHPTPTSSPTRPRRPTPRRPRRRSSR